MRPRLVLTIGAALLALACNNSSGPGVTLQVTPDPVQLVRNDSTLLSVSAIDGSGHLVTGVAVTFTSADTTIATVTNLGLVRARTVLGETIVNVSGGGARRDVPVIVYAPPSYIVVGPADTLVSPGQTVQMHATAYDAQNLPITGVTPTWESSDTLVASVSTTGLVRAKSSGTAFITARLTPAVTSVRVRVRGPTAIVVTPVDTAIDMGDSAQFRAKVVDQGGDSVPGATATWQSSNSAVATISAAGKAHAVASRSGPVTIEAHYGSLVGTAKLLVRDTTILGNRVSLGPQPFGAAISVNDVAYVTLGQGAQLARADLPSQAFAPAVGVGSVPTDVTFNSTGTLAYATNQYNQNISIVDVANDTVIGTIPLTGDPFEVIVAPGDSVLYVATNAYQVYGVRLATKAVFTQFPIGSVSNGMVVRNDTLLYVSTVFAGTVVEWNLRTRSVGRVFPVGGTPQKIALSADGNTLYIANLAGYVQFWNLVTGAQDGANIMLPAGSAGYGMTRRPTTGLLYVTTAYYAGGSIYVIDPATRAIINAVITNGSTRDVVFDSSGRGFVTNENGWVDFIK